MLTLVYASLCRLRQANNNTRSMLALQQLQRCINVQHVYKVTARQYVPASEARPLPEERSSSPQQQQQQPRESEQQQQQRESEQQKERQQPSSHSSKEQQQQGLSIMQQQSPPQMSGNDASSNMSSEIDIPYNINWIFPRLRRPSKFWYFASQIIITAVGVFSKIVLVLMNRTRVHNKDRLVSVVAKRPKGVPLVTVSNHYSCFDDPGLWGVLPLQHVCNTFRIRWSMAAHDICFTNKYHSLFFMYGKCIPVVRGTGVYQEAINLCIEKCALGHWVHIFPEGKVNMDKEEMRLKWGVGRVIYESPKMPIILPMWHEGMDDVLPNVEPYVFKWRKKVTLNIGKPLDLNDFVQDLKANAVPEPTARKLITDKIQDAFRDLRRETEELHRQRN